MTDETVEAVAMAIYGPSVMVHSPLAEWQLKTVRAAIAAHLEILRKEGMLNCET